jgi:hypothetical protein
MPVGEPSHADRLIQKSSWASDKWHLLGSAGVPPAC